MSTSGGVGGRGARAPLLPDWLFTCFRQRSLPDEFESGLAYGLKREVE